MTLSAGYTLKSNNATEQNMLWKTINMENCGAIVRATRYYYYRLPCYKSSTCLKKTVLNMWENKTSSNAGTLEANKIVYLSLSRESTAD